jgi:hypothetical protein
MGFDTPEIGQKTKLRNYLFMNGRHIKATFFDNFAICAGIEAKLRTIDYGTNRRNCRIRRVLYENFAEHVPHVRVPAGGPVHEQLQYLVINNMATTNIHRSRCF